VSIQIEEYIIRAAESKQKSKLPPVCIDFLIDKSAINFYFMDGTFDSLTNKLNTAIAINEFSNDTKTIVKSGLMFLYAKKADTSLLRGRKYYKYLCKVTSGIIGTNAFLEMFATSNNDVNWKVSNQHNSDLSNEHFNGSGLKFSEIVPTMIGIQCFLEYCWTVEIAFELGAQPILCSVTEEMLDGLLSLRSKPSGLNKLQSVITEVSQHTRKGRNIKRHLRGYTDHLYKGCLMRVIPPINLISSLPDTKKGYELKQMFLNS
jgi:hypothetical protein